MKHKKETFPFAHDAVSWLDKHGENIDVICCCPDEYGTWIIIYREKEINPPPVIVSTKVSQTLKNCAIVIEGFLKSGENDFEDGELRHLLKTIKSLT